MSIICNWKLPTGGPCGAAATLPVGDGSRHVCPQHIGAYNEHLAAVLVDPTRLVSPVTPAKGATDGRAAQARAWGISTGWKHPTKKGYQLAPKGNVPDALYNAWEAAGQPDVRSSSRGR